MKKIKVLLLVLIQAFAFSKAIDLQSKDLSWSGDKFIGDGHGGVVKIKKGTINIVSDVLKKTTIIVDMKTITVNTLKGEWADKLTGHLKNSDFFSVKKFPESKLVINDDTKLVDGINKVKGILYIKEKSGEVVLVINKSKGNLNVSFEFDRTKYDIMYNSTNFFKGLGDKAIKDIVKMSFKVKL